MAWSSLVYRLCPATVLPCALLLAASGCGSSGAEGFIPVSGKVTIGGKALTRGTVSYRADKLRGNKSTAEPYAEIQPDGTYTLYTDKKPGAPPGKYVVLVEASEDIDPRNPSAAPKAIVHQKYADSENPVLQRDVVDNPKPGQYDLEVN